MQNDAGQDGGPRAAGSLLRAGAFGLTAAVAGAGVYAAVVILTGYELGLVAVVLGMGVGYAVAAGHATLPGGWVRALSVVLTLFSLLLSSYLILWLYDGEGFAPEPLSVSEAANTVWDLMTADPVGLLIWGVALLTAFGIGKGEDPAVERPAPDLIAEPDPGTDRVWPVVQVVSVEPQPLGAAELELAVAMRTSSGGFRLRQLSLVASDLPGAVPHLFDEVPDILAVSGSPVNRCRVVDHEYDSAEDAMAAAYLQHPAADLDDWVEGADFCLWVEEGPDFGQLLKPDAERVGAIGAVAVGLGSLMVGTAVIYGGYLLNVWVGLDTPERKGTPADSVFTIVVIVVGGALAVLSGRHIARLLARRNLARAAGSAPDARYEAGRGPALTAGRGVSGSTEVGTMRDANTGPDLPGRADPSERLVERPRARLFWCAGALVLASLGAVVGIAARDELGLAGALALAGAVLVMASVGVACLRWSITADASGLTVSNLIRRHRIAWPDLAEVRLEKVQADVDLGFHYFVFITSAGQRIRADAPTGRNNPGGKMDQLHNALLDMGKRYAAPD
ncbi:PH domain-containing protein [Humibacillus xanthopallidus]|uniref:PH domain-containing protein n=1 Tax=Humibacillus xanthopallidus TaxID=412689 RepID=UPI00163B21F6|nr:PH domain-containing protein [Humibacillus xanthopallidus]